MNSDNEQISYDWVVQFNFLNVGQQDFLGILYAKTNAGDLEKFWVFWWKNGGDLRDSLGGENKL